MPEAQQRVSQVKLGQTASPIHTDSQEPSLCNILAIAVDTGANIRYPDRGRTGTSLATVIVAPGNIGRDFQVGFAAGVTDIP
jgi:hypothetical protein